MRIWADEHANLERRRLEVQEASVHPVALRDLIDLNLNLNLNRNAPGRLA